MHNKESYPPIQSSVCVGAGAVEFIICQAEIQIAFVEENKIAEVGQLAQSSFITSLQTINVCSIHLKFKYRWAETLQIKLDRWYKFSTTPYKKKKTLPQFPPKQRTITFHFYFNILFYSEFLAIRLHFTPLSYFTLALPISSNRSACFLLDFI